MAHGRVRILGPWFATRRPDPGELDENGKTRSTVRHRHAVARHGHTQAAFAQTQPQGKTRTQVVNELKQAQHDGVVPTGKTQYPPSGELVARNKELHGISVHGGEKAPQADNHDNLATR